MILTGLPGVIVSRAWRSAWRGEGWERGSHRLEKPRGGGCCSAGPSPLPPPPHSTGTSTGAWGCHCTPGRVPGSRVSPGGSRPERGLSGLDGVSGMHIPEGRQPHAYLPGLASGDEQSCSWAGVEGLAAPKAAAHQGHGSPWPLMESQGHHSHALSSGLCSCPKSTMDMVGRWPLSSQRASPRSPERRRSQLLKVVSEVFANLGCPEVSPWSEWQGPGDPLGRGQGLGFLQERPR